MTMIGHWRNLRQSVLLARLLSQIPPPKIGIERRKVKKLTSPIKWLLALIFFRERKRTSFCVFSERERGREFFFGFFFLLFYLFFFFLFLVWLKYLLWVFFFCEVKVMAR